MSPRLVVEAAGETATLDYQGRSTLVPGNYVPGLVEDSVGLVDRANATKVVNLGTDGGIFLITASTPPSMLVNTRYECAVAIAAGLDRDIELNNCHIVGNNPQNVYRLKETTAGMPAFYDIGFRNWSSRHVTFNDCEFDNEWWAKQGMSNVPTAQTSPALAGGNYTLNRALVRSWTDGLNFTGAPCGPGQYVLIHASRMGEMFYATGIPDGPINPITGKVSWTPQSGRYPHADAGIQWNTGANVEVRFSYLGGPHRKDLIKPWPGGLTMDGGNSALMLQQEPDARYADALVRVDGVNVHDSWLAGGMATLNLHYSYGSAIPNDIPAPNNRVVNNRFMVRVPGFNDSGYQIRRSLVRYGPGDWRPMRTDLSGNVEWDPRGPNGELLGTGPSILGTGKAPAISDYSDNPDFVYPN
jgi:hypothetical protein